MKNLIYLLTLFTSLSVFSQKKLTNSQAFNLVAKQAMLSQRMAKNKVYKAKRVNIPSINIELGSSIILFEKNLKTLTNSKFPSSIHEKINRLDLLWVGYKDNIKKNTPPANKKTNSYSKIILDECNEIYNELLELSKTNNSYPYDSKDSDFIDAVIQNNDLKHLSQQLAFYYATYYFKLNKYNNNVFSNIISKIDSRIKTCTIIKSSNIQIAEKTDEVEFAWKKMKEELTSILNNKFISTHSSPSPETIYQKCNKLLKDTDELSRAYKASNDLKNS